MIYAPTLHKDQTNLVKFFPKNIFTLDATLATLHPNLVTLYIEAFNGIDEYKDIILKRINHKLATKIIIDFSREPFDINAFNSMLSCLPEINLIKDILLIHNVSDIRSNTAIPLNLKCLPIDFYIMEAYYKCLIKNHPYDNTPIKMRDSGINLLIGKVKVRFCRFLTSYYFYKHNLLKKDILGINAYPEDIENMMKMHPKYYDEVYFQTIKNYLGPADNTMLLVTNEGITASHGWPFDKNIFKKSNVSYICETFDMDKGYYPYVITEKFCRTIINRHPFVVQSSPSQISLYKSLGFQTFSTLISEDYNFYNHTNHNYEYVEKTVLAGKELMNKIPENQNLIQEIVNYNFDHFCKLAVAYIQNLKREFFTFTETPNLT